MAKAPAPASRLTARAVLGMPAPPVRIVRGVTRLRNLLGRAHSRMLPPVALILERLTGIADNKLLAVAVELEIPDLLHERPRRADELARLTGANADALNRVLRFLVSRDLLGITRDGRYRNNGVSDRLRKDHPWSFRDWVLFLGSDWHWQIWNQAKHAVLSGESAAVAGLGHSFFAYVNEVNPAAGAAFNGAMAAGSRLQGLLVLDAYDFAGVRHVCDLGGGTGAILADILAAHPAMRGTLFELPQIEAAARAHLARRGVADRAQFAGGSFFAAVPQGCDLYTLFAVIHDWDDASCETILRTVARSLPAHGKILVVEAPLPADNHYSSTKFFDLEMLLLTGAGRERTAREYDRLFARAGLRLQRTIPLASLFSIFELVRAQ